MSDNAEKNEKYSNSLGWKLGEALAIGNFFHQKYDEIRKCNNKKHVDAKYFKSIKTNPKVNFQKFVSEVQRKFIPVVLRNCKEDQNSRYAIKVWNIIVSGLTADKFPPKSLTRDDSNDYNSGYAKVMLNLSKKPQTSKEKD
tara:strand:- start:1722 stop:2144 length:423 start_codon:yes stop_codon:yes gene_type:complete